MGGVSEEQVRRMVHMALRNWAKPLAAGEREQWESLIAMREKDSSKLLRVVINQTLSLLINSLKENQLRQTITSRFIERNSIRKTGYELSISQDQVNRYQKEGITQIAAMLSNLERERREVYRKSLKAKLRQPTTKQFAGRETEFDVLVKSISDRNTNSVLLVQGIGGIGKTSLAIEAISAIINTYIFDDLIWINLSTMPSSTPDDLEKHLSGILNHPVDKLPGVFNKIPILVVLDDLGSENELDELIAWAQSWSQPSRFVFTARRQPILSSDFVTAISLSPLSIEDSWKLLRNFFGDNLNQEITIERDAFELIYSLVGGNPLALRVTGGLLQIFPLVTVLEQLKSGKIKTVETMYQSIFRTSFDSLKRYSRSLLRQLAVTTAANETIALEHILAVSSLSNSNTLRGIEELYVRSLIERSGEDHYGLHSLTRSFVLTLNQV
jgi:hypothetical protein